MNNIPMNAVAYVQSVIVPYIQNGNILVDLTCGNGQDTAFLCRNKKEMACVYGIDIQPCAIINTKERLIQEKLWNETVHLYCADHSQVWSQLPDMIDICMMNLGYLPKGDHALHTKPHTTLEAIHRCIDHLSTKGILTICAYPGTDEGAKEQTLVEEELGKMDQKKVQISCWWPLNQIHHPPVAYILQKR